MRFHADLHVHSKYSRATSRDLDLEHLAHWACRKGISVVATGDFTHPAWLAELKNKLVPAEPGLFRLRPEIEQSVREGLPAACQNNVRFMLSVEISTIYKKGEKTRKIHHLLYAPDFEAADKIVARLGRIGNISSDGRPILGLDSRNLLEITLESHPASYLVPAHIWTPWFAVLGSRGGFDSITECYGDLSSHIFALETGLSSDPAMNWRLSMLDQYRLTSNSDAHSPGKLGRETTLFDTDLDYFAIRRALETGDGYHGTMEFFPEEGKYHMDGHRKCEVRLSPEETRKYNERCPVCGDPVTVGVLHRVDLLADRSEAEVVPPATAGEAKNLVPLPEILSEIVGSGVSSKAVVQQYDKIVAGLGPELTILDTIPVDDIARGGSTLLAEAIGRLRRGEVIRDAGYDGEYGVIRLFEKAELQQKKSGGLLFDLPQVKRAKKVVRQDAQAETLPLLDDKPPERVRDEPTSPLAESGVLARLDEDQRAAAGVIDGPLLIIAGPGSGKTRTVTHRIAHLIAERGVNAESCLAITFTRRAAAEMRERLAALVPTVADRIPIHTFHSLGLTMLREHGDAVGLHRGFRVASETERSALLVEQLGVTERKAESLLRAISKEKRTLQHKTVELTPTLDLAEPDTSTDLTETMRAYQEALAVRNWVDFDDLVRLACQLLSENAESAELYRDRYQWISADEFQDVDAQQYQLLTLLAPPPRANLCVIGDPNQAIYGFRGADAACFDRFLQDYPNTTIVKLKRNYRSSGTIVTAASQVITAESSDTTDMIVRDMLDRITIQHVRSEAAEAESVVHMIEQLIGGHNFFSIDSARTKAHVADLSFADFAVLYRTDQQAAALGEALARSGMPFQKHSHEPLAQRPEVQTILRALETLAEKETRPVSELLTIVLENDSLVAQNTTYAPEALQLAAQQLRTLATQHGDKYLAFAEAVTLATESDTWDPRADRISLLTMHAAKGLEFPVVFLVGLEDGILPLRWGDTPLDPAALAEERRLFYVGMTRAKDRLILSHATERPWRGKRRELSPSPFLNDIEQLLLQREHAQPGRPKAKNQQLSLL